MEESMGSTAIMCWAMLSDEQIRNGRSFFLLKLAKT